MVQDIPLTIAFLAGILSFLSPCVLPIVPGFISYIVGKSFADLQNSSAANTLKLLPHILLFTLGFSFVFIIMGASIDFLSDIFFDFKKQLNFISGILIVILGLYFIGIIKIPFLDFERKFHLQGFQNNHFFPFIIGVAFAFGWSPCIGPILGSVLAVAIKDSVNGIILLSFYTTGRLTSEMVLKCIKMEIPILLSRSGFTAWAVEIARKKNLTMIGRIRGKRLNILSGEFRYTKDE